MVQRTFQKALFISSLYTMCKPKADDNSFSLGHTKAVHESPNRSTNWCQAQRKQVDTISFPPMLIHEHFYQTEHDQLYKDKIAKKYQNLTKCLF